MNVREENIILRTPGVPKNYSTNYAPKLILF